MPASPAQRARMIAAGPSTTLAAALEYREDIGSMTVDIVDPRVIASEAGQGGKP